MFGEKTQITTDSAHIKTARCWGHGDLIPHGPEAGHRNRRPWRSQKPKCEKAALPNGTMWWVYQTAEAHGVGTPTGLESVELLEFLEFANS